MKYSFILPCRNEEKALPIVINKIKKVMENLKEKSFEIIVSNNLSTDNSPQIAKKLGAKVVNQPILGYGAAYLKGFEQAKGKILILADADDTYDINELPNLLPHIKNNDLILGKRTYFKDGSMHFLNKYIGNPILSGVLRIFFGAKVKDAHSGFRVIKKEALEKLELQTTGMEFASEMIIKASKNNLKIKEIPISYHPRKGETKLRRFRDGWRHLRFMLMHAPNYLFFIPGLLLFLFGLNLIAFMQDRVVYGCFFIILGYQITNLGIYTKAYMKSSGFIKSNGLTKKTTKQTKFESGFIWGGLLLIISLLISRKITFYTIAKNTGFPSHSLIIIALTIAILGIQTIFSSFLISILSIEKKKNGR